MLSSELMAEKMDFEIQDIYQDNSMAINRSRLKNSFLTIPEMVLDDLEYLKTENAKLKDRVKGLEKEKQLK